MTSSSVDAVFGRASAIADAVLWEGYVLYPYRRSAVKNHIRFQWGVVGPAEDPAMSATVLVEPTVDQLCARVRFLHLHRRDDGWDEAVAIDHDEVVDLRNRTAWPTTTPIDIPARNGGLPLHGTLTISCVPDGGLLRVTAQVENRTPARGSRADALLESFVGCHVLFAAQDDAFVSLLDPPEEAVGPASRCAQHRCWPVLVGPEPRRDLVLASPVILYDYPTVAPQSPGDFFDGTEIDEMLTLRVQTLTDEEKAEARATDPRAAAIIDRCEQLPDDVMASLHGGVSVGPDDPMPEWSDPGEQHVLIGGVEVRRGSKVVLRPTRRADIHDMFIVGRTATVAEVVNDVDGQVHLAVLVDDDPAAELMDAHGRFRYFGVDEVEAIATPTTRMLVAGVGNIFRSDDGFGSAVVAQLLQADVPDGATVVDYGIRGVHLAFDLADGVDTLILVDTVPDAGGPGAVTVSEVPEDAFSTATFDAHDLDPGSVFRSIGAMTEPPRRTLVVGCQPLTVEDGIGLSDPVAAAVPIAADKVLQLLREHGG